MKLYGILYGGGKQASILEGHFRFYNVLRIYPLMLL